MLKLACLPCISPKYSFLLEVGLQLMIDLKVLRIVSLQVLMVVDLPQISDKNHIAHVQIIVLYAPRDQKAI